MHAMPSRHGCIEKATSNRGRVQAESFFVNNGHHSSSDWTRPKQATVGARWGGGNEGSGERKGLQLFSSLVQQCKSHRGQGCGYPKNKR